MKKKRWIIESRFYSVGRGWGDWHFTYNSADVFYNDNNAIMKLEEYKREETDTSECLYKSHK